MRIRIRHFKLMRMQMQIRMMIWLRIQGFEDQKRRKIFLTKDKIDIFNRKLQFTYP